MVLTPWAHVTKKTNSYVLVLKLTIIIEVEVEN